MNIHIYFDKTIEGFGGLAYPMLPNVHKLLGYSPLSELWVGFTV